MDDSTPECYTARTTGGMLQGTVTLPNALCVVFVMFVVLLAFDVINIQINSRIIGSASQGVAQPMYPPTIFFGQESAIVASVPTESQESLAAPSTSLPASGACNPSSDSSSDSSSDPNSDLSSTAQMVADARNWIISAKDGLNGGELSKNERKKGLRKQAGLGPLLTLESKGKKEHPVEQRSTRIQCMQKYTFKMNEVNSMGSEDMQWCPGLREVDLKPVDEKMKFLFILGAQKAGTTWLHLALQRHPIFHQAERAYMWGWEKEVRFFNSLPLGRSQEYLGLFPPKKRLRAAYNIPTVFLDSTPNSLFTPTVAPRVKQMIPHAKFVIVLRDPVARTVSSHNMQYTNANKCWNKMCVDETLPLLQEFRKHRDLDMNWPEDLTGCNFNETVEDPNQRKTWGDCWRCEHFVYACKMISHTEATALGGCTHNRIPHVPTMPLTQYALYAAQIAWWMSFFPPESFLILTREELRDPDRVIPALNKVLAHAGFPTARQFTEKLVGRVHGFKGKYSGDMSVDDQLALQEIAEFFEEPNKDLQKLMDTYFPDAGFKGFTPEYSLQSKIPEVTPADSQDPDDAEVLEDIPDYPDADGDADDETQTPPDAPETTETPEATRTDSSDGTAEIEQEQENKKSASPSPPSTPKEEEEAPSKRKRSSSSSSKKKQHTKSSS